jgi:ubiquinone/menaquinone biosynthesis C-methylase UbiE
MAWDNNWEAIFRDRAWGKYPGEDLIRFVARSFFSVENRATIKILEIGCGTGANLWFLAREGFQTYGIDGSRTGVDLAINRLNIEVPDWQGSVVIADAINLPFNDEFFDAVIDIEAISCNSFTDSKLIYKEMARVLKSNGKLYSRCFVTGSAGDSTGEKLGYNFYFPTLGPMGNLGKVRYTSQDDISDLLPDTVSLVELDQQVLRGNLTLNPVKEWLITAKKH